MKERDIHLFITGKPIAKKRPRFARRGKFVTTYNDQQTEEGRFILDLREQLRKSEHPFPIPAGIPITMYITFNMPIPKSMSKKARASNPKHTVKPDLDNLIKFVKDCCNGILWHDDSQVVSITARKQYWMDPSTAIEVSW
jgi:Holliday junction resolvase RusA-like endonuclease